MEQQEFISRSIATGRLSQPSILELVGFIERLPLRYQDSAYRDATRAVESTAYLSLVALKQQLWDDYRPQTNSELRAYIDSLIANGYAETHVGYHADYRAWNGYEHRGAYAQIAAPYGGTRRIYARSYAELLTDVLEYMNVENFDE